METRGTLEGNWDLFTVLDANSARLRELESQLHPEGPLAIYAKALRASESRDARVLTESVSKVASSEEISPETKRSLIALITLRAQIIEGKLSERTLSCVQTLTQEDSVWRGEADFLLGEAYYCKRNFVLAKECFLRAMHSLEQQGAPRKSVLAQTRALSLAIKLDPQKSFQPDYESLLKKAKGLGMSDVAGKAALELSKNALFEENLELALKYANEALLHFAPDSFDFNIVLCHRAGLFLKLKRPQDAESDVEAVKASPHSSAFLKAELPRALSTLT